MPGLVGAEAVCGASAAEGGDGGQGGGAEPEGKGKPTKDDAEATRSAGEEGSRDNSFRDDGGSISMVHRCGLRPAGGEVRA